MSYQPNMWLTTDLHRRIVAAARQFHDYAVLLRPMRRNIFLRMFKLEEHVPDFFKPCFAILAKAGDPDKKPCLVIETEEPEESMRRLYDDNAILWVLIRQLGNEFMLDCHHGGTSLQVSERMGSLFKLLAAPLAWFERNVSFPQGSYVHSFSERVLREAVQTLSPSYRIECHHQVPLAWVIGYREDLSQDEHRVLRSEIDVVVTQSFEADPDCAVILPVKLDLHDSHRSDQAIAQRDAAIRAFCQRVSVPLMSVKPGPDEGSFEFECRGLGLANSIATEQTANAWAGALAPFLGAALRYAGRSF